MWGNLIDRNIKNLGQVWTPPAIVAQMLSLRRLKGRVLEPSAGAGAFLNRIGANKNAVALEVDPRLAKGRIIQTDFFAYPASEQFETIIGNPPYVRFQDVPSPLRRKLNTALFDGRTNLYLFFIEKAVRHLRPGGELIFITPRDFTKATSARRLNRLLYESGSFTHFTDLGDARLFEGAQPNCAIWRWVKGRRSKRLADGRRFHESNGLIWFGEGAGSGRLGDSFSVRVGAVSGADPAFTHETRGCTDFVCSHTHRSGQTRRMIYNRHDKALDPYKDRLLSRAIRRFDESNWWQWGRNYHESDAPRIYVNAKTRTPKPFFTHKAKAWDGSILALFPKSRCKIKEQTEALNAVDWKGLGFICDGRLLLSQRSLENAPIRL